MNQPAPEQENNQEEAAEAKEQILSSDGDTLEFGSGEPDPEAIIAELRDQLARALAEAENTRKRSQRDLEEKNKFAIAGFARELVSVLENLQRAMGSITPQMRDENAGVKNLAMGVEMILNELLGVFNKFGIRRIEPKTGDKFDHNQHQAMSQVESADVEEGAVLYVMQAGYTLHERLLQPALVAVAKKPGGVDTQA